MSPNSVTDRYREEQAAIASKLIDLNPKKALGSVLETIEEMKRKLGIAIPKLSRLWRKIIDQECTITEQDDGWLYAKSAIQRQSKNARDIVEWLKTADKMRNFANNPKLHEALELLNVEKVTEETRDLLTALSLTFAIYQRHIAQGRSFLEINPQLNPNWEEAATHVQRPRPQNPRRDTGHMSHGFSGNSEPGTPNSTYREPDHD